MTESYRDLLLVMTGYPRSSPGWAIDAAARLSEEFEATLSAAIHQAHLPAVSNWLADELVHASDLIVKENRRSEQAARTLLGEFESRVREERRGEAVLLRSGSVINPDAVVRHARCFDLAVVPVEPDAEYQVIAEALVFGAGRPLLLLPNTEGVLERVMLAWDGSRTAARAIADALPFCRSAQSVALVSLNERGKDPAPMNDMVRHLARHGVTVEPQEVPLGDGDAGTALMEHASSTSASLLVMGGYGHSRTREFILGGATRTVIGCPRLPVLLSH